jgi:hypothetical protein
VFEIECRILGYKKGRTGNATMGGEKKKKEKNLGSSG